MPHGLIALKEVRAFPDFSSSASASDLKPVADFPDMAWPGESLNRVEEDTRRQDVAYVYPLLLFRWFIFRAARTRGSVQKSSAASTFLRYDREKRTA